MCTVCSPASSSLMAEIHAFVFMDCASQPTDSPQWLFACLKIVYFL